MAFGLAPVTASDGTFSAAGAAAWAAGFRPSGATTGGIPWCTSATAWQTTSALTFNATGVAGEGLALAAGIATTDVNALNITQTLNNIAVNFSVVKVNATNTAAGGSAMLMDLQVNTATKFNVTLAGLATAVGGFTTAANVQGANFINAQAGIFFWTNRATMKSPADGHLQITNNAENANGMLSLGSTTLTLTAGALGLPKMTASGTAPGATGAKLEVVAGTNAGTAKLVMYAGTSGTATTIIDNVGAGVT